MDLNSSTPALQRIYHRFATFGKGHKIQHNIRMDSKSFVKFCRDTKLLNRKVNQTSCDLIFTRVKRRGQRSLDFPGFLIATEQIAIERGVAFPDLITFVLANHGLLPNGEPKLLSSPPRSSISLALPSSPLPPSPMPHPPAALSPLPLSPPARSIGSPSIVLLVIDMQLDFYSRNSIVKQAFPRLPESIGSLVEACRRSGAVEVVHLREGSNSKDSPWYAFWLALNPGCDSSADPMLPEPCAADVSGERVFVKFGYDGVGVDSGLVPYLDSRSRENGGTPLTVLVCGLVTSCCVHMNAAGLFLRGYPTFVVADACGDRTPEMHQESLQRESRRSYAVVERSDVESVLLESSRESDVAHTMVEVLTASCWPNQTQVEK